MTKKELFKQDCDVLLRNLVKLKEEFNGEIKNFGIRKMYKKFNEDESYENISLKKIQHGLVSLSEVEIIKRDYSNYTILNPDYFK